MLDDLAMRFVVNCPQEEQESFERLLFQVEQAFWFYQDQYSEICLLYTSPSPRDS